VSRRGWVLFVAMGVIWGVPYLLIKVAVDELAPSTLVLARTVLATALLLPIALARGRLGAVLVSWRPLVAFAVIEIMVPWLLLGVAEQQISSSLTGLLIASVPLVVGVEPPDVFRRWLTERLHASRQGAAVSRQL
jgi:drug/metabolite transporter (DMT)-like permease